MRNGFLLATGLLAGTIIGAGIFSLPYVFDRLGLVTATLFLLGFTFVYFFIHRMYADLALTRDGKHQFISLAETYLPKPFVGFASFAILGELLFVLAVYLILAPSFAELIIPGSGIFALIAFWVLGSLCIFVRLEWLGWADVLGILCVVGIVVAFILGGEVGALKTPAFRTLNLAAFFLPFGPLLFSLSGRPAVPEVVAEYRRAKARGDSFSLTRALAWGTALPAAVYLLFVFGILWLSPAVTEDSLSGLAALPPMLLALLGVLGLITLFTSYSVIGLNVKDILRFDLKLPRFFAAVFVIAVPLLIYLLGFRHFLAAVSFTGGVFLALEGIFVIAMWRRAFPGHRYHGWSASLYLVFASALIYAVVAFVLGNL